MKSLRRALKYLWRRDPAFSESHAGFKLRESLLRRQTTELQLMMMHHVFLCSITEKQPS